MTPFIYTDAPRRATETLPPFTVNRRRRAGFARQAMFAEFGFRHGKAFDQAEFADHVPGARMRLAPQPRSRRSREGLHQPLQMVAQG